MYLQTGAVSGDCCIKAAFFSYVHGGKFDAVTKDSDTVGLLQHTSQWEVWEHFIPPGRSSLSETFLKRRRISNKNIASGMEFKQYTSSSVAVSGKPVLRQTESRSCENILRECCEILKTHLLGIEFLMTLNENGAVKVVALLHKPTFRQSRWDAEAMREGSEGRALLRKRCHVKNHNWMCFIKLYGCLMMPWAVWLGGVSLQCYGSEMKALLLCFVFLDIQ